MKYFFILVTLFTLPAFAEALTVEGWFKLGQTLFDKGVPAILHLNIEENNVTAEIKAPEAECVFKFGVGTLKLRFEEHYIQKGLYEVYLLPVVETCSKFATNPLKLSMRKDFDGKLLKVSILQNSRRNRWHYFISN